MAFDHEKLDVYRLAIDFIARASESASPIRRNVLQSRPGAGPGAFTFTDHFCDVHPTRQALHIYFYFRKSSVASFSPLIDSTTNILPGLLPAALASSTDK